MNHEELSISLKGLPPQMIAALAVRAAIRVRPLADVLSQVDQGAVDRAIAIATRFARLDIPKEISEEEIAALRRMATTAASDASKAVITTAEAASSPQASSSAQAGPDLQACFAAEAAANAAQAAASIDVAVAAEDAARAVTCARLAASRSADISLERLSRAVDLDLHRLQLMDARGGVEPGFDPSEVGLLGPLWPESTPEWYAPSPGSGDESPAEEDTASPISLYFDLAEFSDEEIVEVLGGLSDLYRAIGGDGLVIRRTETLDPSKILTPEEV